MRVAVAAAVCWYSVDKVRVVVLDGKRNLLAAGIDYRLERVHRD